MGRREEALEEFEFPGEFMARLRRLIPAALFREVLGSFAAAKAVAFRVNTLRAEVEDVLARLRHEGVHPTPIPWCPGAFWVAAGERETLTHSTPAADGQVYVQNASSFLPVLALDPQPGEDILDLAAAPGGKTLHIAARMQNRGRIAAVEAVRQRYHRLRRNIVAAGAEIVRCYLRDGRSVGRVCAGRFHRVLLDAPCSTEARFRAGVPESWRTWSLRKIGEMRRKQRGLLRAALQSVRPGGVVVYCTCSFAPEENEQVVQDVISREDVAAEIVPWRPPVPNVLPGLKCWDGREFASEMMNAVRVLPTPEYDGLFLCVLRRAEAASR